MADLAVLSIVLLLAALLLWAWRERGRAIEKALAAEAEARRARQIDSAAADAADLLAAALTSIELARATLDEDSDPDACREWLADALTATRAMAGLLESARVYARSADGNRALSAEACVRLAVTIARADGHGVALRGISSELPCRGSPRAAIALLSELLSRASKGASSTGFVTVELADHAILVQAPDGATIEVGDLRSAAEALGWTLGPAPDGRAPGVEIGLLVVDGVPEGVGALRRTPAGVVSH